MKHLVTMQKGDEVLRAIERLSENDLRVLWIVKAERPQFLDLNITAHNQHGIDDAVDIVSKLKKLGLISELTDYRRVRDGRE